MNIIKIILAIARGFCSSVAQSFISAAMQLRYDIRIDSISREQYGGQWLVGIHVKVTPSNWSDFTTIITIVNTYKSLHYKLVTQECHNFFMGLPLTYTLYETWLIWRQHISITYFIFLHHRFISLLSDLKSIKYGSSKIKC